MIVRRLLSDECEAYWAIRLQALQDCPEAYGSTYEEESAFSPETKAARCQWTDDQFVVGAFSDDGLLHGIIGLWRETRIKSCHKAAIVGFYVLPKVRGNGVGTRLFEQLLREARTLPGLERLWLCVVVGNETAKRLYERYGFEVYGVEPDAKRQNGVRYDMVFMTLGL